MNKRYIWLILVLALLFRVVLLGGQDLYYDEHGYLNVVSLFLEGESLWEVVLAQPPPLAMWIQAIPMYLFGISTFTVRIMEALFGVITVGIVYLIMRKWYDEKTSLLAAALMAVVPIHVLFSRSAFVEIIVTLLSVIVIYCYEEEYPWYVVGLFFGLAMLTKFSALTLVALYFIFVFLRMINVKDRWKYFKLHFFRQLYVTLTAIGLLLVATGFKPQNIFALSYGFVYLSVIQSVLSSDPFYYVLMLFYQGLSPLLFLVVLIGILYLWKSKEHKDGLLVFLVVSFIVVTLLQGRSSVRHLVLIIPFTIMLVSRTVMKLVPHKNKVFFGVVIGLMIFYPAVWTVAAISENISYTPWSEMGEFVDSLPSDISVKYTFPYHSLASTTGTGGFESFYTSQNVEIIKSGDELVDGDYYLIADFSIGSSLLYSEPLKTDIYFLGYPLYLLDREVPFPALEEYVKREGTLVKSVDCQGTPCLWLYQLETVGEIPQEEYTFFANADKKEDFFRYFCEKLDGKLGLLPSRLKGQIDRKCVSLE